MRAKSDMVPHFYLIHFLCFGGVTSLEANFTQPTDFSLSREELFGRQTYPVVVVVSTRQGIKAIDGNNKVWSVAPPLLFHPHSSILTYHQNHHHNILARLINPLFLCLLSLYHQHLPLLVYTIIVGAAL